MSVIYLKHELHGTKVACSEAEAVYDETKGWKRYEVAALLRPSSDTHIAPVQSPPGEELSDLREKYAAKFGSKPHHKKSADTLRRELEA
jgi:hypothetical protein